ncbi:MAG: hypothetical protein J6T56_00095 [Bacteroidales bacterium]|nr:hypothetical protein [Bacteroidales bacterium]MBP5396162.1 hypothetical protein [Bacteroidales bacterium]MBP5612939.1 hypothetical protein [Bacteroidales bacterium]
MQEEFFFSASERIALPTGMPVNGSNTPGTEVLVRPVSRVEMETVSMETIVGNMAKPIMSSTSAGLSTPKYV